MTNRLVALAAAAALALCAGSAAAQQAAPVAPAAPAAPLYTPVSPTLPDLKVTFTDPAWTGVSLPAGQQCSRNQGSGSTPPLRVENIPAGTTAIILQFNDTDYAPLSTNGGHGQIGFTVNAAIASLPAVKGETATMPAGVFIEANNRASGPGYLPPCSGGAGHLYFADVLAVSKADGKLLAKGRINLGKW